MAAAAPAIPGFFDAPRQSPQKMGKYLSLIPGLTGTELKVARMMIDDGYQGVWFHEHRRLANNLRLKNLRWIRQTISSLRKKLGEETLKVWGAKGLANKYLFSEERLFRLAFPDREWIPRKPSQLTLSGPKPTLQRSASPPAAIPKPPTKNPIARAVENALGWTSRQASYDEIADAWRRKWRERALRHAPQAPPG